MDISSVGSGLGVDTDCVTHTIVGVGVGVHVGVGVGVGVDTGVGVGTDCVTHPIVGVGVGVSVGVGVGVNTGVGVGVGVGVGMNTGVGAGVDVDSGVGLCAEQAEQKINIKVRMRTIGNILRRIRIISVSDISECNCSVVCEGEQMYGSSGEVSEGSPSDYDPFKLHVTAYRVHGPDAAPARSEAERHPEPFPQDR